MAKRRIDGIEVVGDALAHDGQRSGQTLKKLGRASERRTCDAPDPAILQFVSEGKAQGVKGKPIAPGWIKEMI